MRHHDRKCAKPVTVRHGIAPFVKLWDVHTPATGSDGQATAHEIRTGFRCPEIATIRRRAGHSVTLDSRFSPPRCPAEAAAGPSCSRHTICKNPLGVNPRGDQCSSSSPTAAHVRGPPLLEKGTHMRPVVPRRFEAFTGVIR